MTTGQGVVMIPVPELEAFVRERTAFYDASFLSEDPSFVHAHLTLLAPFPPNADLTRLESVIATTGAFDLELGDVASFDDGLLYLAPVPSDELEVLTRRVRAAYPECPPYEGRFEVLVPHVTLDQASATVSIDSVRAALVDLLPVRIRVDQVHLQWWQNDASEVLASWKLAP